MDSVIYLVLVILSTIAGSGLGLSSGAGVSQVGYNIYPDSQAYHAARFLRDQPRQQEEKVNVAYTVQHPRNPNPAGDSLSRAFWNKAPPAAPVHRSRALSQQQQQQFRRPQQFKKYVQQTQYEPPRSSAPVPREVPVQATYQVTRDQNKSRFQPYHRLSNPSWFRAREETEEMRQHLSLDEALDPSQPLRYYK